MNYRYATIIKDQALGVSGTETISIKIQQPISRLDLMFSVTKSLNDMQAHPAADILKIELVDGSDVLHGLSGYENQALCIFDRRVPTMLPGVHLINNTQRSLYGIDFGRFLYDPELAFDPTKFLMPQLKITYNSRLSDTGATSPLLTVMAHVFDEKVISPIGFLMSKEHHSEAAPALDSYKYVDLPTDFSYRRLLLRAYEENEAVNANIKGVRLDEDNEKRILWDILTNDYINLQIGHWEQVREPFHVAFLVADDNYYFTPSTYFNSVGGEVTALAHPVKVSPAKTAGRVSIEATAITTMLGQVMGYCPNHCIDFEFGDPKDIADWYDVGRVGSLRLRVQGGATGTSAEFQVVIQQLRRY